MRYRKVLRNSFLLSSTGNEHLWWTFLEVESHYLNLFPEAFALSAPLYGCTSPLPFTPCLIRSWGSFPSAVCIVCSARCWIYCGDSNMSVNTGELNRINWTQGAPVSSVISKMSTEQCSGWVAPRLRRERLRRSGGCGSFCIFIHLLNTHVLKTQYLPGTTPLLGSSVSKTNTELLDSELRVESGRWGCTQGSNYKMRSVKKANRGLR